MKYLKKYILTALLLGITFSCTDILDEARPGAPTENQFMDSEEKFEFLIAGVYQKLIFFHSFNGGNYNHGFWMLPDDNLTIAAGGRALGYDNFSALNSNTYALSRYYDYAYQLINRANTLLEFQKDDQYGNLYEDMELKDHHRGEALFLRGYMYLKLWMYFGTPPLNLERIVTFDATNIPNSSGNEALDQAISDLQEASMLLKDSPNRGGGIWNETAYGMLGKALMVRGSFTGNNADFTAALAAFNQITSRELVADYTENFLEVGENNDESLFEVQVGRNSALNNRFLNNDRFAVVGDLGSTWIFFSVVFGMDRDGESDPTWVRNDWYRPTTSFAEAVDENDGRLPDLYNTELNEVRKYMRNPKTHGNEWGTNFNNPRILRYSDVLLLKAEAIIRTGGSTSEAIGLVNEVRERAGALPADDENATSFVLRDPSTSDAATILEWIFEERRVELAFEEDHRWWDMRRRHALGEINLTTYTQEQWGSLTDVQFTEANLIYPFPQSELVANSRLDQNDGY